MNIKKTCRAASEMSESDARELAEAVRKYVFKHYKGLPVYDLEDLAQGTIEEIFKMLPSYDEVRGGGDYNRFVGARIRLGALKAYSSQSRCMGASLGVQKIARLVRTDLENGLSVDEAAKKWNLRKNKVLEYMDLTSARSSMDADGAENLASYKQQDNGQAGQPGGLVQDAEQRLGQLTELERFVLETYASLEGKKGRTRRTVERCSEWGVPQSKAMEALRKVRGGRKM